MSVTAIPVAPFAAATASASRRRGDRHGGLWRLASAAALAALALILVLLAPAQAPAQSWSGWRQVPGGGATTAGPATAVFEDSNHVFVRGTDDRIYLNRYDGATWTGWSEVPGGGRTPSPPHAAVYRDRLHLFTRGTDNRMYLNRLSDASWT